MSGRCGLFVKGWVCLALLLLGGASEAWAACTISGPMAGATWYIVPTKAIDGSKTNIGDIVYQEEWTKSIRVNCDGAVGDLNFIWSTNYTDTRLVGERSRYSDVAKADSEVVSASGSIRQLVYRDTYYGTPTGPTRNKFIFAPNFSGDVTLTLRVKYRRTQEGALSSVVPAEGGWTGYTNGIRDIGGSARSINIYMNVSDAPKVINATCSIGNITETLSPVPLRKFTGIGHVESAKDFNIPLNCSGMGPELRVGLTFDTAAQDSSGASGVIKTDQGSGNASGIGLQIINRTSSAPIAFGTFEPGTPNSAASGVFNNPYTVRYYQTKAAVTPGSVAGRVVATVSYQ